VPTIVNILINPYAYWSIGGPGNDYLTDHNFPTAFFSPAHNPSAQNTYDKRNDKYVIMRGIFALPLTSMSPTATITAAKLICPKTMAWATHTDFSAIILNATSVPYNISGYGAMLAKTFPLASHQFNHPLPITFQPITFTINATGIEFIQSKLGMTAWFGLRLSTDIDTIAPGYGETINERQQFVISTLAQAAYFELSYTS